MSLQNIEAQMTGDEAERMFKEIANTTLVHSDDSQITQTARPTGEETEATARGPEQNTPNGPPEDPHSLRYLFCDCPSMYMCKEYHDREAGEGEGGRETLAEYFLREFTGFDVVSFNPRPRPSFDSGPGTTPGGGDGAHAPALRIMPPPPHVIEFMRVDRSSRGSSQLQPQCRFLYVNTCDGITGYRALPCIEMAREMSHVNLRSCFNGSRIRQRSEVILICTECRTAYGVAAYY